MASGACVLIGLGNIGLQLLKNLSRDIPLLCIDGNDKALETARQLRGEGLRTFRGDATSRLVLEEAGVADADTVIISTTTEKINIEIARILQEHFDVPRIISVGITQRGIAALDELGVEVESIFNVSATGLRNRLESKTKTVHGIGLGKNEILEVEIHPHSRLANKPLGALNPRKWRVGIIYRGGNIIVPEGDTVLRPKDKLVILGDPKVIKTVSELITFRFTQFPLEYGDTLVAWFPGEASEELLAEISYIFSIFPLQKALFLSSRQNEELNRQLQELSEKHNLKEVNYDKCSLSRLKRRLSKPGSYALLVLPKSEAEISSIPIWGPRRSKHFLNELGASLACPILLASATLPYKQVGVPGLEAESLQRSLEATLEISSGLNYKIHALLVSISKYIASEEQALQLEQMEKVVSDLGLIYKTRIESRELTGNPIRSGLAALAEHNLVVSDIGNWQRTGALTELLRPDVSWQLVRRTGTSCLLIPPIELLA